MGFREMLFRGMSAGSVCGNVGGDGILPETEAYENMGRHVNGVGGVRGDGGVAAGSVEAPGWGVGAVGGVNYVIRKTMLVRIFLQQRRENTDGLFFGRQPVWVVRVEEGEQRKSE